MYDNPFSFCEFIAEKCGQFKDTLSISIDFGYEVSEVYKIHT